MNIDEAKHTAAHEHTYLQTHSGLDCPLTTLAVLEWAIGEIERLISEGPRLFSMGTPLASLLRNADAGPAGATAMSRREDVEALLDALQHEESGIIMRDTQRLCCTLADEVDARDAVITRLLELLKPQVLQLPDGWSDSHGFCVGNHEAKIMSRYRGLLHARACEIAGRDE